MLLGGGGALLLVLPAPGRAPRGLALSRAGRCGAAFLAPSFGATPGLRLSGVTPPGVLRAPGASGGFTPGGDELDGAVVEGVRVDGLATAGELDRDVPGEADDPPGAGAALD